MIREHVLCLMEFMEIFSMNKFVNVPQALEKMYSVDWIKDLFRAGRTIWLDELGNYIYTCCSGINSTPFDYQNVLI